MPLTLVIDPTDNPAYFGLEAARLAVDRGALFRHVAGTFDLERDIDAAQHVFRGGGLGASGLVLAEQLLGADEPLLAPSSVEEIVALAARRDVVVPVHPRFAQETSPFQQAAERAGVACETVEASSAPDGPADEPCIDAADGTALPILFVGRERDLRDVCPAAFGAVMAAARLEGIRIDARFVDPKALSSVGADLPTGIAGILLPGGSDMGNVAGQITAARYAMEARLPVLGLCLGMQSMATAFAQHATGSNEINLEEVDPAARVKSFVAMADDGAVGAKPLPVHRTGEHRVEIVPSTRLQAIIGGPEASIRYNHRYRLSPALRPQLADAGLTVNATSEDDRIVDGIEWADHPFFLGLQGHPEIAMPGEPILRVFAAFLRAARDSDVSTRGKS